MLSLFKVKAEPGGVELRDVPMPTAGPGQALIKINAAAICGTDMHIYGWNAWAQANYKPPTPMGHEFCGEVLEVGTGVETLKPGDRVTAETHLGCGVCPQCRSGRAHTCYNLKLFSKLGCGCFSEYSAVPVSMLRPVAPGVSDIHGAIMEPLGIAARAVADAEVSAKTVLVMGCGPVGLFAVACAKTMGASAVFAVDVSPQRLALALEVGASAAFNPKTDDVVAGIRGATDGRGVETAIEASGSPAAIAQCFAVLDTGSRMVMVGLPSESVAIDVVRDIINKERTLIGAYGRRIDDTWLLVERLLKNGLIHIDPLLASTFPLEEHDAAFKTAAAGGVGKVLFIPGGKQ